MGLFDISREDCGPESRFTVTNRQGLGITVSTLGAALRSCRWQGRELTLGFADPERYRSGNDTYFAVSVGRFANRIAGASCQAGGKTLKLAANNGPNHLHGGVDGFHLRQWDAAVVEGNLDGPAGRQAVAGVRFRLASPDGDQGYPGSVQAEIDILVSADSQLLMAYRATASAETPLNLTNHAYWNLQGEGQASIHDHSLRLGATGWLEVDGGSIPTGRHLPLAGSAWDFRQPRELGGLLSPRAALTHDGFTQGIDHNFIIDPALPQVRYAIEAGGSRFEAGVRLAAELTAPGSGSMAVLTSLPGIQVYTANYLNGQPGRQGPQRMHGGICLETQYFPDSPNQAAAFRKIGAGLGYSPAEMAGWDGMGRPGQPWQALTVHRFG
jgi:aldose 1-epimerase